MIRGFGGYLIKKENISGKPGAIFTQPLGIIERFLYTAAIIMGLPEWIPIWLGLKVAVSWKRWQDEKQRGTYNIFLIGSALSLIFGFLGVWIALGRLPTFKTKG